MTMELLLLGGVYGKIEIVVWQSKINTEVGVTGAAKRMVEKWRGVRMSNRGDMREVDCGSGMQEKWKKPDNGWIKANIDVALFDGGLRSDWTCVVRNENGEVLGMFLKFVMNTSDPNFVELLCIREVLRWIKLHFEGNLFVESNSLHAVSDLNEDVPDTSYFGYVVWDCKAFFDYLLYLNFCFVRGSAKPCNSLISLGYSFYV